jgi:hypothetical protein
MDPILIGVAIAVMVIVSIIYWALRGRARSPRLQQLSEESRREYAQQWHEIETEFIDDPRGALRRADQLAVAILSERGAEMHSDRTMPRHLREGRRLSGRDRSLHKAMQRYQAIVDAGCGKDMRRAAERGHMEIA